MWGTVGLPILVVASAFAAAVCGSVLGGSAGVAFLGLMLVLPRLFDLPALNFTFLTGLASVAVLCVSVRCAFARARRPLRLPSYGALLVLGAMGAVGAAWAEPQATACSAVIVALLWAWGAVRGRPPATGEASQTGMQAWMAAGVAAVVSLASGASGLGLGAVTDAEGKMLGDECLRLTGRALLLSALMIAAAKALTAQTPPILAGGVALGALPGMLLAFLLRRRMRRK
jgi:hypothetical protein